MKFPKMGGKPLRQFTPMVLGKEEVITQRSPLAGFSTPYGIVYTLLRSTIYDSFHKKKKERIQIHFLFIC